MIAANTPFDQVLADLSDRMGILHTWGSVASQEARVEWKRNGRLVPEPAHHRDDERTVGRLRHPLLATIYGATDLEVCNLLAAMWGHLDEIVGPATDAHDGFVLLPGEPVAGGDGLAAGYSLPCGVELFTTASSEIFTRTSLDTATASGSASDASATTSAAAPSFTVDQG